MSGEGPKQSAGFPSTRGDQAAAAVDHREDFAREVQEQLAVALELSGLGRYAIYLREPRVDADARYSEIIGQDAQELMLREGMDGLFRVVHVDDIEHVQAALETAMRDGTRFDMEYRIWQRTPDGPAPRRVLARGRVESDAEGPTRIVGVIEDITDSRNEAENRVRMQKREALGSLAGGIAHDFNNVISAILSNARLAEAELGTGQSPAASIREIHRAAQRAGDLVRRMLAFSREQEPMREAVDLGEVAHEVVALLRPTLNRNTSLELAVEPSQPGLLGDSTQIHQVLVNLISNAAHALGDSADGKIWVSVDSAAILGRNGEGLKPGAFARLRVRDNGPGIPPSVLPRIFDPFYTTKPVGEGTGLGLAAAQTIVNSHGGAITIQNSPGVGATFIILLPLEGTTPDGPSVDESSVRSFTAPRPTQTLRVLFVDDEPALTTLAARALPRLGCDTIVAGDAEIAAGLLEHPDVAFDVLITDLSMPKLSGLELIARARAVHPGLPVVLTSGFLTAEARAEAERLRVDAIVAKPCAMDDLVIAAKAAHAAGGGPPAGAPTS